ncbi:MAG: DUF4465 domain-containing protein, partial [Nannocystaceae bacterium]|nr:DUF4465 domain-containing protein [Nannocystaceae bacterium]
PGFGNQYSSFAGGGAGGSSQYGVLFGDSGNITLGGTRAIQGAYLTNTTYSATSMRDGGIDESGRGTTAGQASSDGSSSAEASVTGQGTTGVGGCAPDEVACVHGGCGATPDACCFSSAPGPECSAEVFCTTLSALRIAAGPNGQLCSDELPLFQCAPGIACLSIVVCDPADPDVWLVVGDCGELPDGLRPCALPGVVDPFAVPAC